MTSYIERTTYTPGQHAVCGYSLVVPRGVVQLVQKLEHLQQGRLVFYVHKLDGNRPLRKDILLHILVDLIGLWIIKKTLKMFLLEGGIIFL
jgi:hypothetical protein